MKPAKAGLRGVEFDTKRMGYRAFHQAKCGCLSEIGTYRTAKEAAEAYDIFLLDHGVTDSKLLNFPVKPRRRVS